MNFVMSLFAACIHYFLFGDAILALILFLATYTYCTLFDLIWKRNRV